MTFESCCANSDALIDIIAGDLRVIRLQNTVPTMLQCGVLICAMIALLALAWFLIREGMGWNRKPCTFCPMASKSKQKGQIRNVGLFASLISKIRWIANLGLLGRLRGWWFTCRRD